MTTRTIDSIPVAFTPAGGWTAFPPAIIAGCSEARPEGAPDLDGFWQTYEVSVGGELVTGHPGIGHVSRVEQAGNRIVITGGGVVHDMRCDGTLEHAVHDVAEFDKATEISVVATFEGGVHVLRPQGMDIEVRRWRDGDDLVWEYVGFTARMRKLAPSDADPSVVLKGS